MMSQRLVSQMAGPYPIQQGQMADQQGQMADQQGQRPGKQVQVVNQQVQMDGQHGQLGIQQGQTDQQGQMGQAQIAGLDPIWTTCPNCKAEIVTTTRKSTSTFQCLVAGLLCCFYPCCFCIPFFKDDWKDVLHTCPKCNYVIGKYKK